jgi:prepilin-type N-terminal cleavage/methylation domain-containing protein
MRYIQKLKAKRGFTIVECLVAIVVFAIMAMIIAVLLDSSIKIHRRNMSETRSLREQRRDLVRDDSLQGRGDNASFSLNFGEFTADYNLTAEVIQGRADGLEITRFSSPFSTMTSGQKGMEISFANLKHLIVWFSSPEKENRLPLGLDVVLGDMEDMPDADANARTYPILNPIPPTYLLGGSTVGANYATVLGVRVGGQDITAVPSFPPEALNEDHHITLHIKKPSNIIGVVGTDSPTARIVFDQLSCPEYDKIIFNWDKNHGGNNFPLRTVAILTADHIDNFNLPFFLGLGNIQ